MNKTLTAKFIISFSLIMLFSLALPVLADNSDNISTNPVIDEIIELYFQSDGAQTESALQDLEYAFFTEPNKVLEAITTLGIDQQNSVIVSLSSYIASGEETEIATFLATIDTLYESGVAEDLLIIAENLENSFLGWQSNIQTDDSSPASPLFDADTLRTSIEAYKSQGYPYDEEWNALLYKFYSLDQELFASSLIGLTDSDINTVYERVNSSQSVESMTTKTVGLNNIGTTSINMTTSIPSSFGALSRKAWNSPSITPLVAANGPIPTIGTMSYSGTITVNQAATLSVVFTETTQTTVARSYYVQIIGIRNSTEYVKAQKSITIPIGSSSKTEIFSVTFSNAGSFYTKVKVYNTSGGTLMCQRTGTNPDISHGKWKITVVLPTNRNNTGTLTLFDASGANMFSCSCLGKSENGTAMNVTNGNTPVGPYTGFTAGPHTDTGAYGTNKYINMSGATGNSYVPPRSGIWIHGGRSQTTLAATYGCVRVFNANMLTLTTNNIDVMTQTANGHNTTGDIIISEQ
ncbi:MAG: L,D-transpeptidase [Oscillospiraceae bacterium]|jgi:hypothetical protein|nr:L,D-transpeptidase [Oscillospiraceae bacterium]